MRIPAAFLCGLLAALVSASAETVPLPPDPHELVTGSIQTPSTPADRASALSLLERAKQNADMHMPGTPPFNMKIGFNAGGSSSFTGPGTISEVWFSGQHWRYEQSLAGYSETRIGSSGRISAKETGGFPLRVAMLRAAMFWPVGGNPSNSMVRTSAAEWNGHAVTCLLLSGGGDLNARGRNWEETEYCVDNASGLLQVYSRAPGTYVVYGYGANLQFHGRQVPDQLTIFVDGQPVLEGRVTIEDAAQADISLTTPEAKMPAATVNSFNMRFPLNASGPVAGATTIKPVIVNATIDTHGKVVEAELSAASDPTLVSAALDYVRSSNFGNSASWRQAYINVRFASR